MKQFLSTLTDTKLKKIILQLFVYSLVSSLVFLFLMPAYTAGDLGYVLVYVIGASTGVSAIFLLVFLLIHSFVKKRNFFIKSVLVISLIISGLLGLFSIFGMLNFVTFPATSYFWHNLLYSLLPFFFLLGSVFLWLLIPKTKVVLNLRRAIHIFIFVYIVSNISRLIYYAEYDFWSSSNTSILGIIPFGGWLFLVSLPMLTLILNTYFFNNRKKIISFILIVFYLFATLVFLKITPYTCSNNNLQTYKSIDKYTIGWTYKAHDLESDPLFFLNSDYYDEEKTIIKLTSQSRRKLKDYLREGGSSVLSKKLNGLSCLEELDLRNSGLSEVDNFPNLKNLKNLDLSLNTELSDITFLSRFTKMERLNLRRTSVSDLSPIANLPNLKFLLINKGLISKEECEKVMPEKVKCE